MVSERKVKGDIATSKVISDLTEKGYIVFIPAVCEHASFDLIAYKDNKSIRIQAKYSSSGLVDDKTVWNDKKGSHVKIYAHDSFDYYAIYIPQINKICYPNISFGGRNIRFEIPNSPTPYYWYEDFLELTDAAVKRKNTNLKYKYRVTKKVIESWISREKITWPTKEELEILVWEKPTIQISKDLGISDVAIAKRVKKYGIKKPPRGYWAKLAAGKIKPGPDQAA